MRDIPYAWKATDMKAVGYAGVATLGVSLLFLIIGFISFLLLCVPHNILTMCFFRKQIRNTITLRAIIRIIKLLIVSWILFCVICVPFTMLSMFDLLHIAISIVIQMIVIFPTLVISVLRTDEPIKPKDKETDPVLDLIDGTDKTPQTGETPQNSQYIDTVAEFLMGYIQGIQDNPCMVVFIGFVSIAVPLILVLPTCSACFTDHPYTFTTRATRKFHPYKSVADSAAICKWNTICHVYLTVPQDMSSSMILNFHSYSQRPRTAQVCVHSKDGSESLCFRPEFYKMRLIREQERYQYYTELVGLTPDTLYIVTNISVSTADTKSSYLKVKNGVKSFLTGPSTNDSVTEIKFTAGGDMEWSVAGKALAQRVRDENPLFAIVGGDIAYENGIAACYMRMDEWFYNWVKYTTTTQNRSLPILSVIGNHEAGGFRKTRSHVPFYLDYFPHEIGVKPSQRLPYHHHIFGKNMFFIALDSYVITPILGKQYNWLKSTLESIDPDQVNRFVVYHASAYPTTMSTIPDIASQLQNHYVPLFEQYGVKVVYENHYHVLQQSHPIRNNAIDPATGIYYVGQGSWGLTPRSVPEKLEWWADKVASLNVIYSTTCNGTSACELSSYTFDAEFHDTVIYSNITLN